MRVGGRDYFYGHRFSCTRSRVVEPLWIKGGRRQTVEVFVMGKMKNEEFFIGRLMLRYTFKRGKNKRTNL